MQSAEDYADETQLKTVSSYSDYYQELLSTTSSSNTKAKNISDFVTKVTTSGGYYIGRYEAGDSYATDFERTESTDDTNPMVSKLGVYPYSYITQAQASNLCQNMYSSSNFDSDLINSYAWDTAIVFIQKFSGDIDYSIQGRFQSILAKCGEAHSGEEYDVRCNIYDMAGNTSEWSTETYCYTLNPTVNRGSRYSSAFFETRVRVSNTEIDYSDDDISARPILYL